METLALTGPDSHRLELKPGVGSCTLGPKADLDVAVDDRLDWTAFDRFSTPAGSPWPRWIGYEGNDTGWVAWSQHRLIENFSWTPHAAQHLDASQAQIGHLSVTVRRAPLRLVLSPDTRFSAAGDLSLLTPELAAQCPSLEFRPDTTRNREAPCTLPPMPALAGASSVDVSIPPLRQPFDCSGLLQFPNLSRLVLAGSLTGLSALAKLPGLTTLQLRYVPDLSELPPLETWPDLSHLIVWNCDAQATKRIRSEARRSDREWSYCSITKPRTPEWFATEYGLPFSAWPTRSARVAVKAYRAAQTAIASADSEAQVQAAIHGFAHAINRLPNLETTEREDLADAVALLATETPQGNLRERAASWLEASLDF